MYIRESSMPSQETWEALFDVESILDHFSFSGQIAELGCGYGTFSLALARRTSGMVYAIDIDPAMVATVRQRAALVGITNIDAQVRDVSAEGFGLPQSSCDACLLFNVLHGASTIDFTRTATQVLRPNGLLGVIHWRSDIETPRGPPLAIRPTADAITEWASKAGDLSLCGAQFTLPPWHYGLKFTRTSHATG